MPAWRCELDHVIAFKIGGRTIYLNVAAVCKHHHRIKHMPGWEVRLDPDATMTWTTPSGRTYRTHPPNPLGDDPPDFDTPPNATPRHRARDEYGPIPF